MTLLPLHILPAASIRTQRSGMTSSDFFDLLYSPPAPDEQLLYVTDQARPLFNGLRVRMGTATGLLEPGQDVNTSPVWDLGKGGWVGGWLGVYLGRKGLVLALAGYTKCCR